MKSDNIVEQVFAFLLHARTLAPYYCIEEVFLKLIKKNQEWITQSRNETHVLVPHARKVWKEQKELQELHAFYAEITSADNGIASVYSLKSKRSVAHKTVVDLRRRVCECFFWQSTGVPCLHAAAAFIAFLIYCQPPAVFVGMFYEFLLTENWQNLYNLSGFQMRLVGTDTVRDVTFSGIHTSYTPQLVVCEETRAKTKRIKSNGDAKTSTTMTAQYANSGHVLCKLGCGKYLTVKTDNRGHNDKLCAAHRRSVTRRGGGGAHDVPGSDSNNDNDNDIKRPEQVHNEHAEEHKTAGNIHDEECDAVDSPKQTDAMVSVMDCVEEPQTAVVSVCAAVHYVDDALSVASISEGSCVGVKRVSAVLQTDVQGRVKIGRANDDLQSVSNGSDSEDWSDEEKDEESTDTTDSDELFGVHPASQGFSREQWSLATIARNEWRARFKKYVAKEPRFKASKYTYGPKLKGKPTPEWLSTSEDHARETHDFIVRRDKQRVLDGMDPDRDEIWIYVPQEKYVAPVGTINMVEVMNRGIRQLNWGVPEGEESVLKFR
jgi:hypothetical protein